MKRVRIQTGTVGIVTKNGDYQRVISAGTYWLGWFEEVRIYDMSLIYNSDKDLNIMTKDAHFLNLVEIVEVADNQIALFYENGNYKSVFTAGKWFYWKGLMDFRFDTMDLNNVEITENVDVSILRKPNLEKYVYTFDVKSFEEGLLFIDGKFISRLTKGMYNYWKSSINVEVLKVDMRQLQLEISGQEMLTKDKTALRVNFYSQYKVVDAKKALLDNKDFEKQLYILMQLALREFIGSMTLDEMLDNKDGIANYVINTLQDKATNLGVDIIDCGVRDIILPGDIKNIMNQVLIATKQAQANTIARREETASTRSLLNTAKLMEDNAMLFKLKEMEYIEKIAGKIGEITVSGGNQVVDQLKDIFTK